MEEEGGREKGKGKGWKRREGGRVSERIVMKVASGMKF